MRTMVLMLTGALLLGACSDDDVIFDPGGGPAPPIGVDAAYYNRAVTVYWELASGWDGEAFRVFSNPRESAFVRAKLNDLPKSRKESML